MIENIVQSLKQEKEKEKEKERDRSWSELPFHLLCPFSVHLILKDLSTFHAICKSWWLSSPMSPLRPLLDPTYCHSSCLMQLVEHECTFFHPMHDNGSYQMDILELRDAFIRYLKYRWVLLSKIDDNAFFFSIPLIGLK